MGERSLAAYKIKGIVNVAESWYTADLGGCRPDLARYFHLPSAIPGSRATEFTSIWIDLRKDAERILAGMNRTTRNEVRRAEGEGLAYHWWHADAGSQIEEFWRFYGCFAEIKQLGGADRQWLQNYAACGALDFSVVRDANGCPLVWHAHYRDPRHARLRYSASLFRSAPDPGFRNQLGRANRYQTWQDIKRFKADGLEVYDFGRWYTGENDVQLLSVNKFKEGFGGAKVKTYHCTRAMTLKGRLFCCVQGLRNRLAGAPR